MFHKITFLVYLALFSALEFKLHNGLEEIIFENDGNQSRIIYKSKTTTGITIPPTEHLDETTSSVTEKANNKEDNCPKGLTYYRHFLGVPFCYHLTEPQTFPPLCPYSNYLEFDTITGIYKMYRNVSLWVQAQRDFSNGFGDFQYLDRSSRYLSLIKHYENPEHDILNKSCLVRLEEKYIPVLCTEKYKALCIYSPEQSAMEKFCTSTNDYDRCISTGFDLNNNCYCTAQINGFEMSRNDFCSKLAEPLHPFQSHLLFSLLHSKSPCWFGIEKTKNDTFKWSSSNLSVDYEDWKSNIDMSKNFGALDYSNPKGWILENDFLLKCAVCESEVEYKDVVISLKYLSTSNVIQIKIMNMFHIHYYFMYNYVLSCFSDFNGLKIKIVSQLKDDKTTSGVNDTTFITIKNYYPAYFWCETIQRPNFSRVISNKILAYVDNGIHNHEYALVVTNTVPDGIDPILFDHHVLLAKNISLQLNVTNFINVVRPIKIIEFIETENFINILFHISTAKNELTSLEEFLEISDILENMKENMKLNVISLARSEVCIPNTTESNNITLHWPETPIGSTVTPKELCLTDALLPVTRKCTGNFTFGGVWEEVNGVCSDLQIPHTTLQLYDLLNSEENCSFISERLNLITKYHRNLLVIDIHLVVDILEKLSIAQESKIPEFMDTISNVMAFDSLLLNNSQKILNSTDRALDVLDKTLTAINVTPNLDFIKIRSQKLIVQVSDLSTSNVVGIVIRNMTNVTKEEWIVSKAVYVGVTIEEMINQDVNLGIFLEAKTITEIKQCLGDQYAKPIKLILTFFHDDVLFNEFNSSERMKGTIISVVIPDFNCEINGLITVLFKPSQAQNLSCGFWNYGIDENMESLKGNWKIESKPEMISKANTYAVCKFSHATHFALLMVNENVQVNFEPETDFALRIITAIGCGLSLLGVLGIFVTALLFKSWRSKACNIININFSVSIAGQMVFLFMADHAREASVLCKISGASLHYTTLSEFSWMLIIAILQYRKFVLVFEKPIRHLVLKCILIGWCLPLIPIIISLSAFPDCYEQNIFGLCYPHGIYFYYEVLFPITVIVSINLYVFIKILLSVCRKKVEAYGSDDNHVKLQVLLAILLFFLLGMSWIFGLCTALSEWIVWSYLFCLTATFQGFVIFIFFIVMNEKSRLLWKNLKKCCGCTRERNWKL